MKNLLLLALALSLGGCFAGVETKSGWHMVSLPPSSGQRLRAQCSGVVAVKEYRQGAYDMLKEIQAKQDAEYKNIIRDLEMENAALRAANEELLKGYPAFQ